MEAESIEWFLSSMEAWRIEMKLETFDLVAHRCVALTQPPYAHIPSFPPSPSFASPTSVLSYSMGGYFSILYAIRHPERVNKLVLVSPCGLPAMPATEVKVIRSRISTSSLATRTFATMTILNPASCHIRIGWIGRLFDEAQQLDTLGLHGMQLFESHSAYTFIRLYAYPPAYVRVHFHVAERVPTVIRTRTHSHLRPAHALARHNTRRRFGLST